MCDKKFKTNTSLSNHLKTQHNFNIVKKKNSPGQNETIIIQAQAHQNEPLPLYSNFPAINLTNSQPEQPTLDTSLDNINLDIPIGLEDLGNNNNQQITTTNTAQSHVVGSGGDLITFNSSQGFMTINSEYPVIPTESLNTQNLYTLLVKLQQTNKLEINKDSLTSQFFISSQELSSLLEPNQQLQQQQQQQQQLLESNTAVTTIEQNNNSQEIVNQNIFGESPSVYFVAPTSNSTSAPTDGLNPDNVYMSTDADKIAFSSFSTNASTNAAGCQELCCLLKFNALNESNGVLF